MKRFAEVSEEVNHRLLKAVIYLPVVHVLLLISWMSLVYLRNSINIRSEVAICASSCVLSLLKFA